MFFKSTEKDPIKTFSKWTKAYQVFVAILAEKYPHEIANLMLCAQTVQTIAGSCGDQAALQFDEKFRRWRQKDPASCPWQQKNAELYQEALVLGLDYKSKYKKQQPFRAPLSIDTVLHITTMAPAPKKMHAPTLMFVKFVQANTVENSAQSLNRISQNNSPGIQAQAVLSPSPFNKKVRLLSQ